METIGEVLAFAIQREDEAVVFYTKLAEMVESPEMKKAFLQFASEEEGHSLKLKAVLEGKVLISSRIRVPSLGISDAVVSGTPADPAAMRYQDALILAMDREKASFRMYTGLADMVDDPAVKDTFLALAQEEAKHKLRFEIEYDEVILREN